MDSRYHRFCCCLELLSGLDMNPRRLWSFDDWWTVLAPLDPRDARVVVLHVVHGLGKKEIGERLDVSRGRVLQLWQRALRRLERIIEPPAWAA